MNEAATGTDHPPPPANPGREHRLTASAEAGLYAASALVVLALGTLAGGIRWPQIVSPIALAVLATGATIAVLVGRTLRQPAAGIGRLLASAWLTIWVVIVCITFTGHLPDISYGDTGFLAARLDQGALFPRWLAGSAVLDWLHTAVWHSPFLTESVPPGRSGSALFVSLAGATVMCGCGVAASLIWARRFPFSVVFSTFSPFYLMLATGYDEYYPFVAGSLVVFLCWLFARPVELHRGEHVGIVLAFLTLLYVPLAPLAAVVAVVFGFLHRPQALRMVGAAAITFPIGIAVFWPTGISHFFRALHLTLNLGDANTGFARYVGQAAGADSIFFKWSYALSLEHLKDLLFMGWWSGVLPTLAAVLVLTSLFRVGRTSPSSSDDPQKSSRRLDPRFWLATAVLIQQLHYFVFMIPKLGPRQDIDLFFSVYLILAFTAGTWLDHRRAWSPSGRGKAAFIAAYLGASIVSLVLLRLLGIPAVK